MALSGFKNADTSFQIRISVSSVNPHKINFSIGDTVYQFFCRGAALLTAALSISFSANTGAAEPSFYKFQKLSEGVYAGMPLDGTLQQNGAINCNVMVVIRDSDVVLVDGATETESVKRLLADLKTLTDKPVRFVVNTHFHFDHASGNAAFGPDVQIIQSEYTSRRLSADPHPGRTFQRIFGEGDKGFVGSQQQLVTSLKTNIAKEADPTKKEALQARVVAIEAQLVAMKKNVARAADVIVRDKHVIPRSAGEIQVLNLGRGHTGGDLVVHLPREGVVATGDLVHEYLAFMGDAYVDEWPLTLEKVKQLQFKHAIGGHGAVLLGTTKMTAYQAYLRDYAKQAVALKKQGVAAEDAPKKMDLSAHADMYPGARNPPTAPGVIRYYELLDGKDVP